MIDGQGKMLMLTEFSLLSQLSDMKGVVHAKDFFKVRDKIVRSFQFLLILRYYKNASAN